MFGIIISHFKFVYQSRAMKKILRQVLELLMTECQLCGIEGVCKDNIEHYGGLS